MKVAGRRVVVVGGGAVAEGKVDSLLEAGARVSVVSPQMTPRLERMAQAGEISVVKRPYDSADLDGALFVIAATDAPEVQQRVWNDAHARGISVNTVDEPAHCDFITPGVIRRGDLLVTVSTSGKSPAFTAWLKARLADIVTADFGRAVSLLGSIRGEVRRRFRTMAERKRVYERIIASGIVDWVGECDENEALRRTRMIVNDQTLSRRIAPTSPGGRGQVFLVGAGPGDPDLITVKGMRCLRQADVVLHDRLVDPRLLEEARTDAMIIDVGKRKGTEDAQQVRIQELMVKHAKQGLIVCRLKGGDPFVFGRLSEEVRALAEAGVHFEIVPGVSSVTAVPGNAGVFLTERGVSHGFMVLAAPQSLPFDSQEWDAARTLLMAGGSVVVMMGLARTPRITEWLLDNGCPSDLPAAVISRGTWQDEESRFGAIETIAEEASGLKSPAILVLGIGAARSASPLSRERETQHVVP